MIGCYSGVTTPNTGATHQSVNDIAIMRSTPNIVVVETADPGELGRALEAAMEYKGPVFLRMIRGDIAKYDVDCVSSNQKFSLFKSTVLREGKDISLVASGVMVPRALEAADILGKKRRIRRSNQLYGDKAGGQRDPGRFGQENRQGRNLRKQQYLRLRRKRSRRMSVPVLSRSDALCGHYGRLRLVGPAGRPF